MANTIDRAAAMKLIESVIAGDLGQLLARGSTRAQCEALGYLDDTITLEQLETLLDKLGKGMRVFVGGPRTTALLDKIREDVRALASGKGP
jgi:hypothetical protein